MVPSSRSIQQLASISGAEVSVPVNCIQCNLLVFQVVPILIFYTTPLHSSTPAVATLLNLE